MNHVVTQKINLQTNEVYIICSCGWGYGWDSLEECEKKVNKHIYNRKENVKTKQL